MKFVLDFRVCMVRNQNIMATMYVVICHTCDRQNTPVQQCARVTDKISWN